MIVEDEARRTGASNAPIEYVGAQGNISTYTFVVPYEEEVSQVASESTPERRLVFLVNAGGVFPTRAFYNRTDSIHLRTHSWLDTCFGSSSQDKRKWDIYRFDEPKSYSFQLEHFNCLRTADGGVGLKEPDLYPSKDSWLKELSVYSSALPGESQIALEKLVYQEDLEWIKDVTGLPWERVGRLLGVTRQTISLWRKGEPITDDRRQRLFKVRNVLEYAAKQAQTPDRLSSWLDTPRGSSGKTPAELLEVGEISKARLMALSKPSPGVKTPPGNEPKSIAEGYLGSKERTLPVSPTNDEDLLEYYDED